MSESNGTLAPVLDLDVKYRPSKLDDVVGQSEALDVIRSWKQNVPRCVAYIGPAGTGKTTLARVVASTLKIVDHDCQEVNCAELDSATAWARDLKGMVTTKGLFGERRMWILDEVQALSKSKSGQEALLSTLESSKPHVLFALCTTNPERVIKPILSRCVKVSLKAVGFDDLVGLINRIAKAERVKLDERLVEKIAEVANGSPRDAVKELQKVILIDDPAKRLAAVGGLGTQKAAFDLVKELMPFKGAPNWAGVAKVLDDIKDEDPEGIRMMLLSVARSGLLKGGPRAEACYRVICSFDKPLYDRVSGHAMLACGAWEVTKAHK